MGLRQPERSSNRSVVTCRKTPVDPLLVHVVGFTEGDAMDAATTTIGTDLKFRLVREDFADAVAWVARILPTRPTVPVLSGVLLTGSEDGLTISGYDYEVSAEVRVAAEIASPEAFSSLGGCCPTSPSRCRPSRSTSASKAPGFR